MSEKNLSLSDLNLLIKETIQKGLPGNFNVVAEISEINESRGHAYLELVEKGENDQLIAKTRATVWANTYRMLKPYFETTTGHHLRAGIKIMVIVSVEFHELYGFSLNIKDIDPTYTIGDIEQKRLAVIQRLEEEGVLTMNKELDFPDVPQRIAVVSSNSAAGFGDFIDQLENNSYNFKFETRLFQAVLQGEETEVSVIRAFEAIYNDIEHFDIVVLLRGGGSKSDLSWFDSYEIASNIAQFPIPVITGIGHERDKTVADMAAHTSLKTPTAVAEFIINHVLRFYNYIIELEQHIHDLIMEKLKEKQTQTDYIISRLKPLFIQVLNAKKSDLKFIAQHFKNRSKEQILHHQFILGELPSNVLSIVKSNIKANLNTLNLINITTRNRLSEYISGKKHLIELFSNKTEFLDPKNILKRGFSITSFNGTIIKSVSQVDKDNVIETKLTDGSFKSKVQK